MNPSHDMSASQPWAIGRNASRKRGALASRWPAARPHAGRRAGWACRRACAARRATAPRSRRPGRPPTQSRMARSSVRSLALALPRATTLSMNTETSALASAASRVSGGLPGTRICLRRRGRRAHPPARNRESTRTSPEARLSSSPDHVANLQAARAKATGSVAGSETCPPDGSSAVQTATLERPAQAGTGGPLRAAAPSAHAAHAPDRPDPSTSSAASRHSKPGGHERGQIVAEDAVGRAGANAARRAAELGAPRTPSQRPALTRSLPNRSATRRTVGGTVATQSNP